MLQGKHGLFQVRACSGYPPRSGNSPSKALLLPGDSGDHVNTLGLMMASLHPQEGRTPCKGETGLRMSPRCSTTTGLHSVPAKTSQPIWEATSVLLPHWCQSSPVCVLSMKNSMSPEMTLTFLHSHVQSLTSLVLVVFCAHAQPPSSQFRLSNMVATWDFSNLSFNVIEFPTLFLSHTGHLSHTQQTCVACG